MISNSELRDRFAIRRARRCTRSARARGAYSSPTPTSCPIAGCCACCNAAAGLAGARSDCERPAAVPCRCESDSACSISAGGLRAAASAAGVRISGEPRGRPHEGAGHRRQFRDRQLQLRSSLSRTTSRRSSHVLDPQPRTPAPAGRARQRETDEQRLAVPLPTLAARPSAARARVGDRRGQSVSASPCITDARMASRPSGSRRIT